jgi:uncharacterized protein
MNEHVNINGQADPLSGNTNRLRIIDCDVHPRIHSALEMKPFLSERSWDLWQSYGLRNRHGFAKGHPYPKSQPDNGMRRDAYPPDGTMAGSSLAFLQEQLLDAYDVEFGIMNPLSPSGQGESNPELSAALATATNEWQLERWARPEPRLKASICVPYEDPAAAVAEIRRRAGDPHFAQVLLMSRTNEPLGRRKYWPIYEAAVEAGLPVGIHVFGFTGGPSTSAGWCSYYIEEMTEHAASCSAMVTSMIMEGLFEHLPQLKVIVIESGFAWMPSLGWRLDRSWKRLKTEVPHLKKAPSEYMRSNIYVTTQPMEESERARDVMDTIDWIGWENILFASDYPHWDFDDPYFAIPPVFGEEKRKMIFNGNAKKVFGWG